MSEQASTFEPWAVPADLPPLPAPVTAETKLAALQASTDVLFQFTGRQWPGIGTTIVRPTPACRCRTRECSCSGVSEVILPHPPVLDIIEVLVDGYPLDPDDYRVDNGRRLVRCRDENGDRRSWPTRQDLTLDTTYPGTWSIEYRHGAYPPVGGVRSAVALATELARAWTPSEAGECRLPKRVTTVSRQGVTLALLDPLSLFVEGRTGLPEVDLWIGSVRHGAASRSGAVIDVAAAASCAPRPRFRSTRPGGS